jgi:hypothetical protein
MVPGKDPTVVMNAVVPDEPDGYRGRRRRFFVTRRAGGAALPILLVAASVVVVLIVIGVSQLLPHQTTGQIPVGSGGGTVADDNGPAQPDPSGGVSVGPSASVLPSRSPSAKPSASPSGGVSPSPTPAGAPAPQPPAAPPPFGPVTIEAEAGVLGAPAASFGCATCSGGSKVRQIGNAAGYVTFNGISAPVSGAYQLTITYELGDPTKPRTFYVSVNGGAAATFTMTSNTTNWNAPLSATVSVTLASGNNSVKFYNPNAGSYAPDLDKISVH